MENKKVVLFGATGTIGAYAALHIKEMGYDVIAIGHRKSDNGFFAGHQIPYYSMDISNKSFFSLLPGSDIFAVIHLAGSIPARMKGYTPQQYIDSIMTGTLNALDYAVCSHADKFIFTQSISDVAHLCGSAVPIPSDSISYFPHDDDHSIYSICKTAAVNLVEHYHYRFGIRRYVLRLPNIYLFHPNPKYYFNGEEKWQSYRLIINNAMQGLPVEVWGTLIAYGISYM